MRNARKWLSLLLALALVFACLPQMTLPAQAAEEYDLWVGGVQVDSSNAGDVLGDGKVVYTPAAGSEPAKLTLNNASITGTVRPDGEMSTAGIYARTNLTLELVGSSEVNSADASDSSYGILALGTRLTVIGDGTLNVTAGDSEYSCGVSTDSMIMRSGTVRATAGKASDESEAFYSNNFIIEGGTLTAEGGESAKSWGIGGTVVINGGTVTAVGQIRAFWREPDLSGYDAPKVLVSTNQSASTATPWSGTDALGGDGSSFKYVHVGVEPAGYDLWVGGVRVDSSNAGDVLGDGTVVFTPATESEQAKLTLNNAAIPGAARPDAPNSTAGIYAGIDLTLELVGSSEITGTDAISSSFGILLDGKTLTVTGSGLLIVYAGDGVYSCAISTNSMTMRSGAIAAYAGKASGESEGVYSNNFTMEGGILYAEGGEGPKSWGVGGSAAINGGVVEAYGDTRAFFAQPGLSGYADPIVMVNTAASITGATSWNGTDALGGEDSSFKCLRIEPAGYDVWVGGVRVADSNRNDVLADGGSVKYTPATGSEQAKLTLNNASITGAVVPVFLNYTAGIYAEMDLTLELIGSNEVTGTDSFDDSYGVLAASSKLTVIGGGTLDVSTGDGWVNCAVGADSMIMRSGTIRATAGKASYESEAVFSYDFTMEGGTLIAEAGEALDSYGFYVSAPTINGGTVVAIGQTCAFYGEPDLSGYADPDVRVNTEADYPQYAKAWNGTDDLGEDGSFQCVIIEPAGYDLWVGGVRVTEANKADVLGDGTVAFTPATESEQAKLTLNGAEIIGAPVPAWPHDSDGIYSDIDLTLELHGENTVTANDAWEGGDCLGIFAGDCSLIVTGDGILNVTTGEGRLSCGVDTFVMTMHSGTLRVTAGKATETSDGVYSLFFTMEGGTLITEAGEAPESWGFVGQATINGGTIEATGQSSALYIAPKLSGDAAPAVMVNTEPTEIGAKAWNGTDDLSKDGSFKYVKIARYNPFTDVAEGAYYYDAVLWAVEHDPQITKGTDATHFSPDATCTRGQVVTFLWRAAGAPEPTMALNPFSDVKEGAFYYKAVLWAVQTGITKGVDATHFGPDRDCTRGQVVAFLHRAQGTPAPGSDVNPFVDVKEGAFYYDAVLWAVEKNVTKGTSETTFSPDATCTRGQIVTFLYRAMK